jgi:chemotaxis protein CheC
MVQSYFSTEGINELKKMATEGAEGASKSLSTLINQKVSINAVTVRATPVSKISKLIAEPNAKTVTIRMGLSGDVFGVIMLIYPEQSALNINDILKHEKLGETHDLNSVDDSALAETGNIVSGSFLTSISNYLKINMLESVPTIVKGSLENTVKDAVKLFHKKEIAESIAMEINFNLSSGGTEDVSNVLPEVKTTGYFILLLDADSGNKVLNSLKTISGGNEMLS